MAVGLDLVMNMKAKLRPKAIGMRDVASSDERRLARKIILMQQKIISNIKKISSIAC
jgi:hypothetical protein